MIQVQRLSKWYGAHAAVDEVSFEVGRGEIVGLLGPNGAGKSTILRVLAGYLPATSGTVRVAGFDVFHQPNQVRRRIGYMPETNPLHLEMRVREYLKFRGRLKGLGWRGSRERVEAVLDQCGLIEVSAKIIGTLSKGYRQRVGLADALVHEPSLIILDEPTIGLDPHQIRAVRQLIKDLGRERTVLLSSHILPEVEMTCQRVLILHRGKILADDATQSLPRRLSAGGQVVAEIAAPPDQIRLCWEELPGVESYDVAPADGEYWRCALTPRPGVDLRPLVFERVVRRGWTLRELTHSRHSLEDIFVQLTRATREGEEEGR
ncbi:MAG: ATP-binding cassette domain-containing protein [Verrucomicrobia bacterium]|nr:ATP-binding cassette domain-containing protein [Verrucomicrobiota bacterium]